MAAAPKKKFLNFKTPIGVAQYTKLDRAYKWDDNAQRSLPNPEGDMSTNLVVSTADAQPLIAVIKEAIKESGVKPKYSPYSDQLDEDEKPTGNVVFKLKAYGMKKDGTINKIVLFDANGKPVKAGVKVTSGSTIRGLGYVSVGKMGARLNLRELQIINLVEREGEGFDAVEGGSYVSEDEQEPTLGVDTKLQDDDEISF